MQNLVIPASIIMFKNTCSIKWKLLSFENVKEEFHMPIMKNLNEKYTFPEFYPQEGYRKLLCSLVGHIILQLIHLFQLESSGFTVVNFFKYD